MRWQLKAFSLAAFLGATCVALAWDAPATSFNATGAASTAPPVRVNVRVIDSNTGAPVESAAVQLIGEPYLESTDKEGWTSFGRTRFVIGDTLRVWSTPQEHAPGAFQRVITDENTWITIKVPPKTGTLSTPLIDHTQGGTFSLSGTVATNPPSSVSVEIVVPPMAFGRDAQIHLLPYPEQAMWLHGVPSNHYLHGAVYVSLTDRNGRAMRETLSAPVKISVNPYHLNGADFEDSYNVATLTALTYDYVMNEWVQSPTPATYDPVTGMIEYETLHFSCMTTSSEGPEGEVSDTDPTPAPAPDPPTIGLQSTECRLAASAIVQCGMHMNSASVGLSATDGVEFSTELTGALEQTYGAEAGNAVLGKLSSSVGVSIGGTLGGTLSATSGVTASTSVEQGGSAWGGDCFSGSDEINVVWETYGVSIGGVSLGVISKPTMIVIDTKRAFDATCCEEEPPLPGGQPETPCPQG
jgi:hypothetical protein